MKTEDKKQKAREPESESQKTFTESETLKIQSYDYYSVTLSFTQLQAYYITL